MDYSCNSPPLPADVQPERAYMSAPTLQTAPLLLSSAPPPYNLPVTLHREDDEHDGHGEQRAMRDPPIFTLSDLLVSHGHTPSSLQASPSDGGSSLLSATDSSALLHTHVASRTKAFDEAFHDELRASFRASWRHSIPSCTTTITPTRGSGAHIAGALYSAPNVGNDVTVSACHTAPSTPTLTIRKPPRTQRIAAGTRRRSTPLRSRAINEKFDVSAVPPLSEQQLRAWIEQYDDEKVNNLVTEAVEQMAKTQKLKLRDLLKALNIPGNSRESSVSRLKDRCVCYGYKCVVELLLKLMCENKAHSR